MRVMTRMVRVRRRRPAVRRAVILLLITLCAYLYMIALRGDPVQAILDARDEERVRREVALDGLEIHAVRTAVCDSAETARVEAARYIPRGAAGYMLQEETWHILCAGYETEAQAKTVRDRLRAEENIACDVLGLVAEKVSVYVTAAPSQIDALIASKPRIVLMNKAAAGRALAGRGRRGNAALSDHIGGRGSRVAAGERAVGFQGGGGRGRRNGMRAAPGYGRVRRDCAGKAGRRI